MSIEITFEYKESKKNKKSKEDKNKKPLTLSISSSEDNKLKLQLLTETENKVIDDIEEIVNELYPLNAPVMLDNGRLCFDLTLQQAKFILTRTKEKFLKKVSLTNLNGENLATYNEREKIKKTTASIVKMLQDNQDDYKNFLKAYATFTNTPLVTFTPGSGNPTFTVSSIPPVDSNNNNLSEPTSDEDKYKTPDATTPVVEREKERKIIEEEDFSEKESTEQKNLSDYIVSEDTTSSPKISSTSEQNAAAQAAAKAQLESIYRDFVLGKFPSHMFKDAFVYVCSLEVAANQDNSNTVTAKAEKDNTSVLIEDDGIEQANVQKDSKTEPNLVSRYYPCDINTKDIYELLIKAGIAPSPKSASKENSSQGQANIPPDYQKVLSEIQEKLRPFLNKKDVKDIPKVYINAYEKNNYSYKQFLTKLAIDIVEANSNPQTRWHVKHSLFGGNLARFRYDIEEKNPGQKIIKKENYIRTVLPRHAYQACKMIAKVSTEYDSQEAAEKIMAMFDREANKPKKSRRQRHQSTQDKYTGYANAEFGGFKKEDFPILADHFKFKELINNLKRSIANTEWEVKYTFFGAGTPVEFKYTDESGEVKAFSKRVPAHVGHMCNVFDRIGKNYSYREAVDDIKKILAREVRTDKDKENNIKAIRVGRMESTQKQYDKYMKALKGILTIKHETEDKTKDKTKDNMEEYFHGAIWQKFDKPVPTFSR